MILPIEWNEFDNYKESEIHCKCGCIFISHYQKIYGEHPHYITRKNCPMCTSKEHAIKVSLLN
jgi:hypothetical protein